MRAELFLMTCCLRDVAQPKPHTSPIQPGGGMDLSRTSTRYGTEDPGPELELETVRPLGAQCERVNCAPNGVGLGLIGMGVTPVMFYFPLAFVEHHKVLVAVHGRSPWSLPRCSIAKRTELFLAR
jgi:hypothetical protein